MKRVLLTLLTSVLLAAGLVGTTTVSPSPASAACPYNGCVGTAVNSEAKKVVRRGTPVRIKVGVRPAGNVYPRGTVTMVVSRRGGSVVARATKTLRPAERYVSRTTFTVNQGRGRYVIRFTYRPTRDSVFSGSTNDRPLRVKPARRAR